MCVCNRTCEPDRDLVCESVFAREYMWPPICALTYCMHVCAHLNVFVSARPRFKSHLVPGHHIIAFCPSSPSHNPSFPECWLCCGSCISLHLFKYGLVCLTLPLPPLPPLFPSVCLSGLFYCLAFETLFPSFPFFCHHSKTMAHRIEQSRLEMHFLCWA